MYVFKKVCDQRLFTKFTKQLSVSNGEKPSIHLHVPFKQSEKGCIHCSVNPHESFSSRFPRKIKR